MDRKEFIKTSGLVGLMGTIPSFSIGNPNKSDKLKIAIVGCGGRGTGALTDMIGASQDIEIMAMGDLDIANIDKCEKYVLDFIGKKFTGKEKEIWKVTPETKFLGLDAIDKVLQTDCDIVALTTPPVFRPVHIEKCLNANKNVFAEKPICIDAWGLRKIREELIPLANAKKLSVLCGTQMRYQSAIQEVMDRIHSGQIGDVISATCLRYEPTYLFTTGKCPANLKPDDIEYQIRNWIAFRWASGDQFVEQYIHNLDLAIWAINSNPVEVVGMGGRNADIIYPTMGDRFSHMFASYQFENGVTLTAACRQEFNTAAYSTLKVQGTKGVADISFGRQTISGQNPWKSDYAKVPELIQEHRTLMNAVRSGTPINTMKTMSDSCYVAMAGREACYSSKRLKCEFISKKSKQKYLPDNFKLGDKKAVEQVPLPATYQLV